MSTAFASFVAGSLRLERFTFVDVGCSGGIDPAWRVFGERLRALAFDASVDECERLTAAEEHPEVRYIAGFVGLPSDHPFAAQVAGKHRYVRNFFQRSSAGRIAELQQERLKSASLEEKLQHNAWGMTKLADPNKVVVVPSVLKDLGWSDVDLIKIDIDGPDFEVLHSFDGRFDELGLLSARLEVNLNGGPDSWEHTFHNTDRFMRARGFELLALDVRNYAMSALPSPFAITSPAQSVTGRPFQAEAFYARDPAGPDWSTLAAAMKPEKLAKLAAIFSVWNQPDAAAEILLAFRDRLTALFDIDSGLELLAGQAQAQTGATAAIPYRDYIAAFEAGAPTFYPPAWVPYTPATPRSRLAAAYKAFVDPDSVSR
ncbi:MAG: FkbM family methyltransferase [Reyranella sp.]|uniref:FkbM family methyltransferase n=1 Tax=Reyranella sp. TaxID=1929291 RepID=UPI002730153F|nr:FkbM family methyltransferase [Reyranella sp.]MDP1963138.1 FkbM family methyltransferase [Reyranella sp.]MDP2377450.1 FkbM family methyltransferase [Reyranella sp.]